MPRRATTWKQWLGGAIGIAFLLRGGYLLIEAARRVPAFGYFFLALALLAVAYDVLMLVQRQSMLLPVSAVFVAATVLTFAPDLVIGGVLALVTVAAYAGIMLLISARQRA